ncbi:hypothetical protein H8E07_22685 [bacterium]|nr:hypothetical protein [bacterium]
MWKTIILLAALWWLWRFAHRLGRHARRRRPGQGRSAAGEHPDAKRDLGDLTRQDISDADYEEIP